MRYSNNLLLQCFNAIKNDAEIVVGLILSFFTGCMAIIIEIYIREWIYSFYDPVNGPLFTKDDVNYYYQYQGTVGTCVTFILLIPTAKIIDKITPKILLPLAFLQRAGVSFIYFFARGPNSIEFYIVAPLLHLSFFFSFISLGAYL